VRLSLECEVDLRIAGTEMRQLRFLDWVTHPVSRKPQVRAKVRLSWTWTLYLRIAGRKKMRQFRILDWVAHPMPRKF
jgi:hypothetical protein